MLFRKPDSLAVSIVVEYRIKKTTKKEKGRICFTVTVQKLITATAAVKAVAHRV
jgi:hypothetical protein